MPFPHGQRRPAKDAGRINEAVPDARAGKMLNRHRFAVSMTAAKVL